MSYRFPRHFLHAPSPLSFATLLLPVPSAFSRDTGKCLQSLAKRPVLRMRKTMFGEKRRREATTRRVLLSAQLPLHQPAAFGGRSRRRIKLFADVAKHASKVVTFVFFQFRQAWTLVALRYVLQ